MITETGAWNGAGTLELESFSGTERQHARHPAPLQERRKFPTSARAHRGKTIEAHALIVQRVIAYMRTHLDADLTLDDLAKLAATSKFHFVRIFEEVTGDTPHHFLTCLRLERAQELLLNSNLSITNVYLDVGYSSHGTFSRTFAFFVGISPSRFRSKARSLEHGARFGQQAYREPN